MTQKQYRYLEFSIVYCQAQASYHRPDMISDHIKSTKLKKTSHETDSETVQRGNLDISFDPIVISAKMPCVFDVIVLQ